jgi:hypothetical protein
MSAWTVERAELGCVVWLGRLTSDGYGRAGSRPAHVVAYERARGRVPEGLVLDHICRRRSCVAWWHLEPVTRDENERRKTWRYRSRIAKCPLGHDLRATQALNDLGGRTCRVCNRTHEEEGPS